MRNFLLALFAVIALSNSAYAEIVTPPPFPSGTSAPTFSASAATTQAISSGVPTKVTLGTVTFDTGPAFATSRFTPPVPGYYQINGTIVATDSVAITNFIGYIYKNGTEYRRFSSTIGASTQSGGVTLFLNGTTDFVELFGLVSGTSPSFFTSGVITSSLSGSFLHN